MLGTPHVLGHLARRARLVVVAHGGEQAAMLGVGGGQHLGRVGDERDQAGHLALDLGDRADQTRAAGGLRQPDVQAHIDLAIGPEVVPEGIDRRGELVESIDRLGLGPFGSEHGNADLQRGALVADVMPGGQNGRRRWLGRGLGVGHEGSAAPSADGPQVAALAQCDESLAQG